MTYNLTGVEAATDIWGITVAMNSELGSILSLGLLALIGIVTYASLKNYTDTPAFLTTMGTLSTVATIMRLSNLIIDKWLLIIYAITAASIAATYLTNKKD